jgi:hypothetical protein
MACAAAGGPAVAHATTGASLAVRNRTVTAKARVRRWPRCTGWQRRRSCRSGSSCYRSATCVASKVVSPSATAIANSSPPRRVLMRMQMPLPIAVMLSTRFRRDAAQRFERRGRLLYSCSCTSPARCEGSARSPPDLLVGVAGFEPTASSSRTKRATKLRHTPWQPRQHTGCTGAHSSVAQPLRGTSVSNEASGRQAKRTGA